MRWPQPRNSPKPRCDEDRPPQRLTSSPFEKGRSRGAHPCGSLTDRPAPVSATLSYHQIQCLSVLSFVHRLCARDLDLASSISSRVNRGWLAFASASAWSLNHSKAKSSASAS